MIMLRGVLLKCRFIAYAAQTRMDAAAVTDLHIWCRQPHPWYFKPGDDCSFQCDSSIVSPGLPVTSCSNWQLPNWGRQLNPVQDLHPLYSLLAPELWLLLLTAMPGATYSAKEWWVLAPIYVHPGCSHSGW